jgi:hypothetical protein
MSDELCIRDLPPAESEERLGDVDPDQAPGSQDLGQEAGGAAGPAAQVESRYEGTAAPQAFQQTPAGGPEGAVQQSQAGRRQPVLAEDVSVCGYRGPSRVGLVPTITCNYAAPGWTQAGSGRQVQSTFAAWSCRVIPQPKRKSGR